jgi:hypothetical protein
MLGADTAAALWYDLGIGRQESLQHLSVLIINVINRVNAEEAIFFFFGVDHN